MDTTMFFVQIWGPILLAVGVGVSVSRDFYIRVYRELEKETFAVLMFGMVAMAMGIVQIQLHNVWNTLPQIIISLLGWGLLIKGVVCVVAPRVASWGGDWVVDSKLIPTVGGVVLLGGAYLSWLGYLV